MLAIHQNQGGFFERWVAFCKSQGIAFKSVNCYANDLMEQLNGCSALLWHHNQADPRDMLIAKQILFALEHTGFKVFPDFRTAWHFDDKVGQKYLLERVGAPCVPTWIFYDRRGALEWASGATFPKVWKLRSGAGSANVQLVRTKAGAVQKIKRAFGKGFSRYDAWGSLCERWRRFRIGESTAVDVLKGLVRLVFYPQYARIGGRERGYVYFQEFVPNNDSDIRVVVIDQRAFALKRFVRKGDFRASGSGHFAHEREAFNEEVIRLALKVTYELGAQCLALDFVFDDHRNPLLVEISYGFSPYGYDQCPGYWDNKLRWHEGTFDPYGWMVELVLSAARS